MHYGVEGTIKNLTNSKGRCYEQEPTWQGILENKIYISLHWAYFVLPTNIVKTLGCEFIAR